MEIRNPWAGFEWTGDYSDDCPLWTDELKEAYGFTEVRDDGVFFMPFDDYFTHFETTFVNYDTSNMYRDDWLILDDHTENSPGYSYECGDMCTEHIFTLTSEVDQKVIVSANTWQERGKPAACEQNGWNWHIIDVVSEDLEVFELNYWK